MNTKKDCCELCWNDQGEDAQFCKFDDCDCHVRGIYVRGKKGSLTTPEFCWDSADGPALTEDEVSKYITDPISHNSQGEFYTYEKPQSKESSEEVTDEELDYALGHVESSEEKMRKGAKLFARDFTGVMKELAEESEPSFTEKTIEDFRETFSTHGLPGIEQWLTSKLEETWDHGFAEGYNASTEDHTDSTHNMHSESAHAPPSTQKEEGIVQERARTLAIIEKHKEDSRSDGSFKHDDCYEALKEEIEK